VVCLAPQAPGDSVRPRRSPGVVVRPLNFAVRGHRMTRRTGIVLAFTVLLSACGTKSGAELRTYKDPLTGAETKMRVARLEGVEVAVMDSAPSDWVVLSIDGRGVLAVLKTRKDEREITLMPKADVTVTTSISVGKLKKVEYWGSQWHVWDENGDGQPDTRVQVGSKTVEIWLNGHWLERRTVGNGTSRQYFVGERKVLLTDSGWQYDGP
jgi:hypothetical protein